MNVPDTAKEQFPVFEGFTQPTSGYFAVPNAWTDICADIESLAELKILLYILRHTWGYQEYGLAKALTIDELAHGRKRRDGTRMDEGTGLSKPSVIDGLKRAIADGYLLCTVDETDRARIKKSYALKMYNPEIQAADKNGQDVEPWMSGSWTPDVQKTDLGCLDPKPPNGQADVKEVNPGCPESRLQMSRCLTPDVQKVDPRCQDIGQRSEKDTEENNQKKDTGENNLREQSALSTQLRARVASFQQKGDFLSLVIVIVRQMYIFDELSSKNKRYSIINQYACVWHAFLERKDHLMSSTIDFGLMLQPFPTNFPGIELAEYNRRLIRILSSGFTTLWMEDHLQWGETPVHECLTTLSYFAGEFPQFRIGSLVMSQGYRNPALLAKMAANLQLLSGGRFILGLGAGWKADEYYAYGYPFPNTRIRMEELEEAAQIIKTLWSESPATFVGKHYQIRDAYCEPQPTPAIPLLIGGGGEEKTLAIVARHADWWNFNSCTVEEYTRKTDILKKHCAKMGRNVDDIKLTYLSTASVSEDPSEVVRNPQKHFVAGSSAEVVQEIEQFQEAGVSHFMFRFLDPESLERFVQTVVPYFV